MKRRLLRDGEFSVSSAAAASSAIERGAVRADDMYPLDAPGIPLPGPEFIALAAELGDDTEVAGKGNKAHLLRTGYRLEELYRKCLYASGQFQIPMMTTGGQRKSLRVVSGHIWSSDIAGPRPARVMVVGKMLGEEERNNGRNLVGPSGKLLQEILDSFEIKYGGWYVTNLMKTEHPEGDRTEISAKLVKEWLPILHQEIRLVQPQYILCLGADASKALLGKSATVTAMEGRVGELEYQASRAQTDNADELIKREALVMVVVHPASVLRWPDQRDKLENGLLRFGQLIRGVRWDKAEEGLDHRVIDNEEDLQNLYYEIKQDCVDNLLAIDAEWHGEHPQNQGAYLRTIQVSWRDKTAACISLRHAGGTPRFKPSIERAVHWLKKICRGRRIAGHFFNSDLEWLVANGLDLRPQFEVAGDWMTMTEDALKRHKGGFDTGLAMHATDETADLGLTALTLRFTSAPRYDVELDDWKKRYCKENGMKAKDLAGFGECPDAVLEKYAAYDSDVCRRLVKPLQKRLTCDRFGNNCWEAFWTTMRATPAILEMNTRGLLVDKERLDRLTELFMHGRDLLEQKIREWARWPEFNLASVYHVREFLYGEAFNKKQQNPALPPIRLRPPEAVSLRLEPVLTTDKRPMHWRDVQTRGLEAQKTASTNKTALSILAQESQRVRRRTAEGQVVYRDFSTQVLWVRDHRFVSQVLKSVLREPATEAPSKNADGDEEEGRYVSGEDGYYVYAGGLASVICSDGRVRTHIYPTVETGRWRSARPPLQNLSKRREYDYARILGPSYSWPIRSMIVAPPGHVLLEADYLGAELFAAAILSGDTQMINHVLRNQLAETDSDYYDIHSNIAVRAFKLDCLPTKSGLESIGKKKLRDVAKTVIFGQLYGRGAKAIALGVREEGGKLTIDEAQQVVDTVFATYPRLVPFFAECRRRVSAEHWLCGSLGRFRRFQKTDEQRVLGDFEREAMNFPIQNLIGDAVSRAVDNLFEYRKEASQRGICYWLAMQVHDALLLELPYESIPAVVEEVLPECLIHRIPLHPCRLDGTPLGTGPFFLGFDYNIYTRWGEPMNPDTCLDLGIAPKYAHWTQQDDGWVHPEKTGKIWRGGKLEPLSAA